MREDLKSIYQQLRTLVTWRVVIFALVCLMAAGVSGFILDDWVYSLVRAPDNGLLMFLAQKLSFWGDYGPGTLPLCISIWGIGTVFQRPVWRRIALASLLAASIAGGAVSTVRLTIGRTRPDATMSEAVKRLGHVPKPIVSFGHLLPDGQLLDGLYGYQKPAMFQSFPSGHSATSVATATAITIVVPPAGLVLIPGAIGVCWSRLYLHKHHFSDVMVGAAAGLLGGLVFGLATRRSLRI